ncbi:MAG: hypothetical protein AAF192_00285 [Pseudomonadota bacterium]
MPGSIHAASVETSPRLQRVLRVLEDGGEHSTFDIIREAQVAAVNAAVAELRAAGAEIECRQGQERGQKRFFYKMTKGPDA